MKLSDVIKILDKDKDLVFKRVNDENFIIYRDDIGRLMCKIKDNPSRTLNIFNYMQDLWELKE